MTVGNYNIQNQINETENILLLRWIFLYVYYYVSIKNDSQIKKKKSFIFSSFTFKFVINKQNKLINVNI